MPFAAASSESSDFRQACQDVCDETTTRLDKTPPVLSLVFVARQHIDDFAEIVATIANQTASRHLLACTAEAIVGGEREIEEGPAISLWSAVLPGAQVESFHVEFEQTPDGPICSGLPDLAVDGLAVRAVLMLGDPFSFAVDTLIARLGDDLPGVPLIGGMASGGSGPGENRLGWNGRVIEQGGVGVIVRGGAPIRSIVSQGCRPIGSTFVVTKAEQNVVFDLGGKTALARLEETYAGLSERDRLLIRQGLHLGVVMNEHKPAFSRGDFLIANVLAADRDTGAMAIGNFVRPGQTVQFHVRDAATADEDLRHLLSESLATGLPTSAGALLFSCNGRGTRMFPEPHHDAGVIRELCGPIPVAGLFAQGELGPVGGRNYIHGFTASIALFEDGE
ncbi:MAG: hypothetical protein EXS05_22235 [Planctomycetaceae bacterium]|nr:hypothetical protein [Planctomycetaceae bacterium]